ncbi:MAG: CDP-glycerol glycerophosphotransferase (TagB/SpsB family) [Paraglaciecola sp.]
MKRYLFYISENYAFQVLRPLQEEIHKRGGEVAWFIEGNGVNRSYLQHEEKELSSVDDVIDYQPVAVFAPGNNIPSFIPGIKVSIFHGFVGSKVRKKDNVNYHFIIRDCFDLYCTHGPSSTLPFKVLEEKHKHFKVIETGYCKMDPYYAPGDVQIKTASLPTILFSSTFSPRMTKAPILLETIKTLSLQKKWQWLVTFHPKMDKATVDAYKAIQHEYLTFIETDDLTATMQQADIMLGDNSSMIVDFLLLQKPVVTFDNEDPKPYFVNITDTAKIEQSIEYTLSKPAELLSKILDFAKETHPYTDGKSSARVLDAVDDMLDNNYPLKKKPWNIIRNLKMRKKLGYWKY